MIHTIEVRSFKSLLDVKIELGKLNVFVGANGSGKSNLIEAIGVLSAAADGKVNDQTLLQRGVRPGVPALYKSAFASSPTSSHSQSSHIFFSAQSDPATRFDVSLNNPLKDPSPAWRFKTEWLSRGGEKLASRGPNLQDNPNTENGIAALKLAELSNDDPALDFMRRLQQYVIFSPTTSVLRGVAPETQPRQPVGLSGGRLPEAVHELLVSRTKSPQAKRATADALRLIGWVRGYGSALASDLPLSPSASSSPRVIRFVDKFMKEKRNVLSGYDASEGALYILFLAVLATHPQAPLFFAVDNADHGLNPQLATNLMKALATWVAEGESTRQVLLTSHNPAVLDGLPLQNDAVRLFTVDRDNRGATVVRRFVPSPKILKMASEGWTLSRLWMNGLIGGMPNV